MPESQTEKPCFLFRIGTHRQIRIQAASNLDDLMELPGLRCHPLKGDRKGQYAVKLTGFYWLRFTLEREFLNISMIEEVSKHYDD